MDDVSKAYPRASETVLSPVNAVSGAVARPSETSDDYPDVVADDGKTRVIAADIQWIIQKRVRSGRHPWHSQYFCRSKEGLLMYAPKPTAPELLALPDRFSETRNPTNQRT
jgi:hypothetical protein